MDWFVSLVICFEVNNCSLIYLDIDDELHKMEMSFSLFRDISVLVLSWNCDSAGPDSLSGNDFLHDVFQTVDEPPDIISFGFQEVIDLESRKMAAKNVLLGGKKKQDDALSDKVTGAYKHWYNYLMLGLKSVMPSDVGYTVIHTENLVGLFSCIFVKTRLRAQFDDIAITTIKRGMGGRYGNKVSFFSLS